MLIASRPWLATNPGIGAFNATALVSAFGNGSTFARGRDLAVWLGLVPRQVTTGGKLKLVGITGGGSKYLRKTLIRDTRAAMPTLRQGDPQLGQCCAGPELLADGAGHMEGSLSYSEIQRISRGGNEFEVDRLWKLCMYSNDFAHAAYGLKLFQLYESLEGNLRSFDLGSVELDGKIIPLLLDGINNYSTLSNELLNVDDRINAGVNVDIFAVIPENNRIVENPSHDAGLRHALLTMSPSISAKLVDCYNGFDCFKPILGIRAFDSHPSTGSYVKFFNYIISNLGYDLPSFTIPFDFVPYRCDLASRFSEAEPLCMFMSHMHCVKDYNAEKTTSGIHRLYENCNAPIDKKVLLIGDSHSNSALSQLFSYVFREVRFVWASRRDNYGVFSEIIESIVAEADHVIEEASERFFLRNFCSTM